jgi:protein-tyrosine phosphatase
MAKPQAIPWWIDTTGLGGSPGVRLAIVPCPEGGRRLEGVVRSLAEQGVGSLVSLLSAEEVEVLGLQDEGRLCREAGIGFRWFPVGDHSIPESMEQYRAMVEQLQGELRAGRAVGAHCFAGIGRSCMLMAGLLCAEGLAADEAFRRLSTARGLPVPDTWLQAQWVGHFSEMLEARPGPGKQSGGQV